MSAPLRRRLNTIIFGTDTPAGRNFDVALIAVILCSVAAVLLDSMASVRARVGDWLLLAEWLFTALFTAEYLVRIYCAERRREYVFSFYGLVDLLSVLPTYLTLLVTGSQYLIVIRLLRVLRIFRVLKLLRYGSEANQLTAALWRARYKIGVFMFTVAVLVVIFGSLVYVVEGPENGFTSIPQSIYWAIITITTVGYGDMAPKTPLGQALASVTMLFGYAIIAVPTGILSAEMLQSIQGERRRRACPGCGARDHDGDALFCKRCGTRL